MTMDEIERVLGRSTVAEYEQAVSRLHSRAQASEEARNAETELMIALLAACLLQPRATAVLRTESAANRLVDIVRSASQIDREASRDD